MAGVNWLKKGRHWSRQESRASTPAEVNARLILMLWRLPDHAISRENTMEERRQRSQQLQAMRLQLLTAVAIARHDRQEASRRQVTQADRKRQLKAMLKLDDVGLAKAIEDCDSSTREAISEALNAISLTPEAKWVSSEDPYAMSGMQILAPESVRRSVEIALVNVQLSTAKPGRRAKPYQRALARACHEYWSACRPKGASGRVAFTRVVFEAADWRNDKGGPIETPEDSKNLERLLSEAAREAAVSRAEWEWLRAQYEIGRVK